MDPIQAKNIDLSRCGDDMAHPFDRANGNQPFMLPAKLQSQVSVDAPTTDLSTQPTGRTPWGATMWRYNVQRPGLAQPLFKAKGDGSDGADAKWRGKGRKNVVKTGVSKTGAELSVSAPATPAPADAISATIAAVNNGATQAPSTIAGWRYR